MALMRMDNVLIVVEDLEAVKGFFLALGMMLEGEATVEGPEVGALIGLKDVKATLAMLRAPDGQGGIELDKFHTPGPVRHGPPAAPVNAMGYRRVMFAVEDLDGLLARMRERGTEIIGRMQYGEAYKLAYIRGPEGIIVGLAESIPAAGAERKASTPKPAMRKGAQLKRAAAKGKKAAARKPAQATAAGAKSKRVDKPGRNNAAGKRVVRKRKKA